MMTPQDKIRVRSQVYIALGSGKLVKPLACACGNPKIEAHHPDYSKPLDVEWLCHPCHDALHGKGQGRTHCKNGHELTPENTYTPPQNGRECRICRASKSHHKSLS